MLSQNSPLTGQSSGPCWFVGAMTGGVDQTHRFIDEGLWERDFDDNSRVLAQVRSMQTGERIAIKAAYIKKHGLDFETGGNTVSVMAIKATGVIAENMGDGRRLRVHWQRVSPPREWYFYTYQPTIWKVTPGDWKTDALIDFAFQNKPQDIDRFRNDPYWRERFGTDPKEHKRFDGIEEAITKARGLAFVEEPAVAEILLGAVQEPDVHPAQPSALRWRRPSSGSWPGPAAPAHAGCGAPRRARQVKPAAQGSWTGRPRAVPLPGACHPCSSEPMGDRPPSSTRLQPCADTTVGGWNGPALCVPPGPHLAAALRSRMDDRCHADLRVRLWDAQILKVTVELSDQEMAEVLELTGERKKGPTIRRLMEESLQQRRRAQIAQRFLSGEWGVELETYEADQERERQRDQEIAS